MRPLHAQPPRGLIKKAKPEIAPATWNKKEGRFGRFFEQSPAQFEDDVLKKLADAMVAVFDAPKDGPDKGESGIPALYTYFGQFVDHDLVFDPEASFQKQRDVNAMEDFRTPAFDLDSVYGRGPGDQPYMYDADGTSFELGDPLTLGNAGARDLVRSPAGRALIGDPRNDENAIVSQLQGLFHRFHNRLVRQGSSFEDAQLTLRRHYQHVVLHDFLPKIVSAKVLDGLKTKGHYEKTNLRLFNPEAPFMPVEFSGACYRLGHSMVRPGYRLNDAILLPIFPTFPEKDPPLPQGLTGMRRMISDWGIDWARFVDIERRSYGREDDGSVVDNSRRLQFAYGIDTSLADPLRFLPPAVAMNPSSLALRNLQRGRELQLPSGQAVAAAMAKSGVPTSTLPDEKIIIGEAVGGQIEGQPILEVHRSFEGNCPLWTYVLAEAMQHADDVEVPVAENSEERRKIMVKTPQLGPVGGRIVAEVIVGLMFADQLSVLSQGWEPKAGPGYALRDLVAFALG